MKKTIIVLLLLMVGLVFTAQASDFDTFKGRAHDYAREIVKGNETDLNEKQAILWDLITSEDRKLFDKKYEALDWAISSAQNSINEKIHKEKTKAQQDKIRAKWENAKQELWDLQDKAKIVSEDFYKALSIEFNTGKRPEPKLRFEIARSTAKNDKYDPNTFFGKVNIFVRAMLENQEIDTAEYKQAILWQLLTLEHWETFDKVFGEMMYILKSNSFPMDQKVLATKSLAEYESAMTRQKELEDLIDKANLVRTDFFKVYYYELKDGKKPDYKFSFSIKPIAWQVPAENKSTQAFAKEWFKASQVVNQALSALKNKNQAQFAGLWTSEEQQKYKAELVELKKNPKKWVSSAIIGAYNSAQKSFQEKERFDILPYYMTKNLYVNVESFEDKDIMTVSVRIWGTKRINTKPVYLVKEGNSYKIQTWRVN